MGAARYAENPGNHSFPSVGLRDINVIYTYEVTVKSSSM